MAGRRFLAVRPVRGGRLHPRRRQPGGRPSAPGMPGPGPAPWPPGDMTTSSGHSGSGHLTVGRPSIAADIGCQAGSSADYKKDGDRDGAVACRNRYAWLMACCAPIDSSRAPGSGVAGQLPGIFEDHDLAGPEDDARQEMARSVRQNGTRGRRARAASQPGSQHVDLAAWRGLVEAVLDQPADGSLASRVDTKPGRLSELI